MIKAILNGILKVISKILNVFLLPINALFENLFPDMTSAIETFNDFVSTYLGNNLSYFFSIFPPIFRSILLLWFTFLVSYFSVKVTYHAAIKVWSIIQKVKFW